jgi:hypothetical protein
MVGPDRPVAPPPAARYRAWPVAPTNPSTDRRWPTGWSGPWWLERQRDERSPDWRPEPDDAPTRNTTGVGWTVTGALGDAARLLVDGRGYLQPAGAGFGVDWWIGADDRWHVPGREAAVRQSLLGDAPVVRTTLRVPGGDVHHCVGGIAVGTATRVSVEVVNDSAAPVALALAVRPVTLLGVGSVREVALAGSGIVVDGVEVVRLPSHPSRALLSGLVDGDPLTAVVDGAAPAAADAVYRCDAGLAGAVVIVPLAHRATYRWQVLVSEAVTPLRRRRFGRRDTVFAPAASIVEAPALDAVARGWTAQVERLVRLDLPAGPVTAVLPAVRAHLLLASGAAMPDPEVALAAATAGYGTTDPDVLVEVALRRPDRSGAVAAATLEAARRLGDLGAPPAAVPGVAMLVEVLAGESARGAVAGAVDGLRSAAALLARSGEAGAAAAATRWAQEAAGRPVPVADPDRPADGIRAAGALARAGSGAWLEALTAIVARAAPTVTWPDRTGPDGRSGTGADGHDPVATARFWLAVRAALVADDGEDLALLPAWPGSWVGAPVEVHQLPSAHGLVSFALRWHGERPALLWSVDGAVGPLTVRAPAIDPSWSSTEPAGEALLAVPPR